MADETTRPTDATRTVETVRGVLTYAQLAPLLAERVLHTQAAVARGEFDQASPGQELIRRLHGEICSDLVPDWAGRWRNIAVIVGTHEPPPSHEIPLRMRDDEDDLALRL